MLKSVLGIIFKWIFLKPDGFQTIRIIKNEIYYQVCLHENVAVFREMYITFEQMILNYSLDQNKTTFYRSINYQFPKGV